MHPCKPKHHICRVAIHTRPACGGEPKRLARRCPTENWGWRFRPPIGVAVHIYLCSLNCHGAQNTSIKIGFGWVRKITWKIKTNRVKTATLLSFWVNYIFQGFRVSKLLEVISKVLFLDKLNTKTCPVTNGASLHGVKDICNPLWFANLLTCPRLDGLRIDQCHMACTC